MGIACILQRAVGSRSEFEIQIGRPVGTSEFKHQNAVLLTCLRGFSILEVGSITKLQVSGVVWSYFPS